MLVMLARTCAGGGRGTERLASLGISRSTHQGGGAGRRRISRQDASAPLARFAPAPSAALQGLINLYEAALRRLGLP
jgi:hypothetical protein